MTLNDNDIKNGIKIAKFCKIILIAINWKFATLYNDFAFRQYYVLFIYMYYFHTSVLGLYCCTVCIHIPHLGSFRNKSFKFQVSSFMTEKHCNFYDPLFVLKIIHCRIKVFLVLFLQGAWKRTSVYSSIFAIFSRSSKQHSLHDTSEWYCNWTSTRRKFRHGLFFKGDGACIQFYD